MTKCLNCGAENDPENRFCEECGAALQATCPQCGEKVAPNTKFCPSCGHRIAAVASAPAGATASVTARPAHQPAAPTTPPAAPAAAPTLGYAPSGQPPSAPPPPASYAPPTYSPPVSAPPPPAYGAPTSAPPPYTPSPSYGASYPAAPVSPGYAAAPLYQAAPVFKYKGVWPRFFAQVIDFIIVGIPIYVLMALVMAQVMKSAQPDPRLLSALSLFTSVIVLAYFVWLEAGGGTLGKRVLGIKIVDAQGNKPGLGRSLARNLLRLLDALPLAIPYLLGVILVGKSPNKQRLGDKAAGTFVVGK